MESGNIVRVVHTIMSSGLVTASLVAIYRFGTIMRLLEAFPLIKAFLEVIIAFLAGISFSYAAFAGYAWLPHVKWGRTYADRCVTVAKRISAASTLDRAETRDVMLEVERLELELDKYGIPCPPLLERDSTSKLLWRRFLIIVGTRANQNDLSRARKAFDDMTPDDRQDWKDLEKSLEERYS